MPGETSLPPDDQMASQLSAPETAAPQAEDPAQESPLLATPPEPQPAAPVEEPATDLDTALQALAQKAQYVSNATGAAIALRQGADVVCRAASGSSAPDRGARLQVKTGLTAECWRTGELMRCDNAMTDSRVDLESCRRLGIDAIIIAPIRCGKSLAGVLEIFSAHAYSFQERDVETVKALAEEIGNLLEHGDPLPAMAVAAEAPVPDLTVPAQNACQNCGAKIQADAVFCTACGSFQESTPPVSPAPEATGWKARLNSRRLLVPAIFVAMALAVAVAPISRNQTAAAPVAKPALQASASPATAAGAFTPARSTAGGEAAVATSKAAVATMVAKETPDQGPPPPAGNPTIANSVKQLLGGMSSDFSKLLPVSEKAEPPSNGDPNLRVWVDTRKGYYYCPGEEQYGHTQKGSFMTQKEAEANYYIPALIKPCM
ncbi:MAG: GAF domain-containing protein [Chlamydiota bacterium]